MPPAAPRRWGGDRHPLGFVDEPRGCTCTVAVMPSTSLTLSGITSRWIRTGTRWASRTHVKTGFTSATPAALEVTEDSLSTALIYPSQSCIFDASLPWGARIAN
jgi:hypothetical protein